MIGQRFEKASLQHFNDIMRLFEKARLWHGEVGVSPWPEFDESEVKGNIVDGAVYVLTLNDLVIGTATVFEEDPLIWEDAEPAFYVHRMATDRAFKGNGLSRVMIGHLAEEAKSVGKASLRLDCWAENEKLKEFYRSLGFKMLHDVFMGEAHSLPAHYWNSTTTLFEMRLEQVATVTA